MHARLATTALATTAFATLALACPRGARADDRPPSMPPNDATILYQVSAKNSASQRIRVYFGHSGDLLRSDGPNGEGDTVLDRRTGQLTVVLNGARAYMVIPSSGPISDPFLLDPSYQYARDGTTQTVAGLPCTDWTVTSHKGQNKACVTEAGLLLAASGVDGSGVAGQIRALSVSPAPIPPGTFEAPAGYQRVTHPAGRQ